MMIRYARKYNSKHKMANRTFTTFISGFGRSGKVRINSMVFKIYDIELNGVVYTQLNHEFTDAFRKHIMWKKLNG